MATSYFLYDTIVSGSDGPIAISVDGATVYQRFAGSPQTVKSKPWPSTGAPSTTVYTCPSGYLLRGLTCGSAGLFAVMTKTSSPYTVEVRLCSTDAVIWSADDLPTGTRGPWTRILRHPVDGLIYLSHGLDGGSSFRLLSMAEDGSAVTSRVYVASNRDTHYGWGLTPTRDGGVWWLTTHVSGGGTHYLHRWDSSNGEVTGGAVETTMQSLPDVSVNSSLNYNVAGGVSSTVDTATFASGSVTLAQGALPAFDGWFLWASAVSPAGPIVAIAYHDASSNIGWFSGNARRWWLGSVGRVA